MPVDAPAAAGAPVGVLGADGVGVAARDHRELGEAQATPGKCVRACVRIGWVQQGVERGEERKTQIRLGVGVCEKKKGVCVCGCVGVYTQPMLVGKKWRQYWLGTVPNGCARELVSFVRLGGVCEKKKGVCVCVWVCRPNQCWLK